MQLRAPEAPHEVRRLRRPPLKSWAPTSADSETQRGLFGPLGELGPRPRGLDVEPRANFAQRVK
eukprot:11008845-Alexandrium_andersonii.AAC.1